ADLVAALDRCLWRVPQSETQTRQWLLAVLAAADADAWRGQVRRALLGRGGEALEPLARSLGLRRQPPPILLLLAHQLREVMKSDRLELKRRIQRAYPADLWANYSLALELLQNGRPAEAVRYFTAVLALKPDGPVFYMARAFALVEAGELDAAIADHRQG